VIYRLLVLVALFSVPAAVTAGPFGLTQATPLARLQVVKKLDGDYRYEIRVPTPLSGFDTYIATVTPQEGLCRVTAIGDTLDNDSDGSLARARYGNLKAALTNKYGTAQEFDFVHSGALFDKPSEFAMAIKRNERSLMAFWTSETHANLPPDLMAIQLRVNALSSSATYVNVGYEFANMDACARTLAKVKTDAL
jgi:hypothetical protein